MKLIVTFADEDSFSFRDDTICIRISDVKNLLNIINSAELREEFVLTNKVLLDAGYDELIEKEIYEVEKMPYFKNFNSFNSIRICINRDVDFNELYGFLKGFPYQVIIDTDDVDLTLVYKLCTLDYAVEPLIKNIYNTEIITASEMRESLNVVLGFAGKLNDGKLSDLEKLIFLYDYLKTRIYKEDEDYSKSASLSKVTLGDSIVCLGYANLFSAVVSSFIGFILMFIILNKSQKYFTARQKELGKLNGYIEEVYSGLSVIRTCNAKEETIKEFDKLNDKLYDCNRKSQFLSGLMQPIMGFIGNFSYVAVCIVGALLVSKSVISFGVIVAFIMYVRLFTNPLSQIAQAMTSMQSTAAASERVFGLLEEVEMDSEDDITKKLDKHNVKGNIEFKNVKFGYDKDKIIINDFTAKVKAGEKIAIVGPTGAGKTTMVNLLMKFSDYK